MGDNCLELAYFLHIRRFQESSVLLDCLTEQGGIIPCIAKGARRPKSKWRGLAQPFILVNIAWRGRGEVKTLVQLEAESILPCLKGKMVLIGLYINELILTLVQRCDPSPELFKLYHETISQLGAANDNGSLEMVLRKFESGVLGILGFGIDFERDVKGEMISEDIIYGFDVERGFFPQTVLPQSKQMVVISGASIIALKEGRSFINQHQVTEAKKLMRHAINHYLGGKILKTRKLFSDLNGRKKEVVYEE